MLNLFQHPLRVTLLSRFATIASMHDRQPCVYILASRKNGTLYIGVTSDLPKRLWQHRNGAIDGFAKRYRVFRLVHAEFLSDMTVAIAREKQLKNWHRAWKVNLIEQGNPAWRDLGSAWGIAEPLNDGC